MAESNRTHSPFYNRMPVVEVPGGEANAGEANAGEENGGEANGGNSPVAAGWDAVCREINHRVGRLSGAHRLVVIETYQGVIHEELVRHLRDGLHHDHFVRADDLMLPEPAVRELVFPDVTSDRTFGYMTRLTVEDFFDREKVGEFRNWLKGSERGTVVVYGTGAAWLCPDPGLLVYADMARWEIQSRMRGHLVDNLGVQNRDTPDWALLYKQGFFVDWRVCDRLKKKLFGRWDLVLDTNHREIPKLVTVEALRRGLEIASRRPFSLVPFFDPGPWGGQWMKEVLGLDPEKENYAWCFNCVPEENSLLLKFGDEVIETPAINLVFRHPKELLGEAVHARFGDEFPIRFDFLDTMGGGNLSLQVHPLTEYIQETFGMHYTQDESYYLMEAAGDAVVYAGLKEGITPEEMIRDLETAQDGKTGFDADRYVKSWPVKKHDHVLLPAGTVHCSGKNCMVLEISATPYIFTFKLWDWGRLGLDGKPRPIHIGHGKEVIQWDRTESWVRRNLLDRVEIVDRGEKWVEERTGLHEREFIETRRHWFTGKTPHRSNGSVQVLCLVEGDEIVLESTNRSFDPFPVHYAEVFVVPAAAGDYTVRPGDHAKDQRFATIKAYVRY